MATRKATVKYSNTVYSIVKIINCKHRDENTNCKRITVLKMCKDFDKKNNKMEDCVIYSTVKWGYPPHFIYL
jgi:hypothetical protein